MVTEDSLTDAMREQLQTQCPLTPSPPWYPVEYSPPYLAVREDAIGHIAVFKRQQLLKVTLLEPIILEDVVVLDTAWHGASKHIWR